MLIAGPTSSGKSALALKIAAKTGGAIINADSMQVYRDLHIITARPSKADEAAAPHLLYGHVDAAENYSVGRWCADAAQAIRDVETKGLRPILVGGTGLYYKALTQGLSAVPPTPPEIRSAIRARIGAEGPQTMHAELVRRDPAGAARIREGDSMRIGRALEVLEATGRSLSDWHKDGMPSALDPDDAVKVFLSVDRGELYRRIDMRFDAMLAAGALEEVRTLAARNLDPLLPAMKAHGVPWLIRHIKGEMTLGEAADEGKRDTRRYTKRQETWFRNQMPGWRAIAPTSDLDDVLK